MQDSAQDSAEAIAALPVGKAAGARQNRSVRIVQRSLARAEPVFAQAGLAGATMASLAAATGLPRANLHYHFGTKENLYAQVLENILALWLNASDSIHPGAEPGAAFRAYIAAKLSYSRDRPFASKVFANEILHGAVHLRSYLGLELRRKVDEKAAVIEGWIAQGKMDRVDPRHLLFLLWAMTQTYADFDSQIAAVLGVPALGAEQFAAGQALIVQLVLRGCGIDPPSPKER
ncbi:MULTISPECIES: TetR/AcrR family transcriptional regulator [Acidiphilium]|uniref:TetR/AcrR family transcriptional regulator n=1 Tax=Acidiphilium TaxID=522 RepID=UPI00257A7A0C|nr:MULTISPECIES: TetR/AcrR family transcriptional regulator [Acidiphilium]HQT84383.1 TetR/AcrR family transcriptional regulator [Acidiphilium rubrum]